MQIAGWFLLALVGALDVFNVYLVVERERKGSGMSPFRAFGSLLALLGGMLIVLGHSNLIHIPHSPRLAYITAFRTFWVHGPQFWMLALLAHILFRSAVSRAAALWTKTEPPIWFMV